MELKELMEQRLKELDWTVFRLTKEVAKRRGEKLGEEIEPRRLHSTVRKVLDEPESARWGTTAEVIEALGGNLSLEWPKRFALTR